MKKTLFLLILFVTFSLSAFSQIDEILGKWETTTEKNSNNKAIVYIFKATNGKYYGKVEKLFNDTARTCMKCDGSNNNKPILGMLIIKDMIYKNNSLVDGTICDPFTGKDFKCKITFNKHTGKLNVRKYLDKFGFIGRTETWTKEP